MAWLRFLNPAYYARLAVSCADIVRDGWFGIPH